MNKKERNRNIAYEVIVILGLLALLTFICRLWPILLLIILGIFAATIRLLFLSSKKVEVIEPLPLLPEVVINPTEEDVQALAYSVILRRITMIILSEYPEARWIWETPNAQKSIEIGDDVYILLNRAGGYRRAKVVINNLQVVGIEYCSETEIENSEGVKTVSQAEDNEDVIQNYELLAFEWVQANIFDLNSRCNEAIGESLTELVLLADELPVKESWPDICKELNRAGLTNVKCVPEGIKINLTQ